MAITDLGVDIIGREEGQSDDFKILQIGEWLLFHDNVIFNVLLYWIQWAETELGGIIQGVSRWHLNVAHLWWSRLFTFAPCKCSIQIDFTQIKIEFFYEKKIRHVTVSAKLIGITVYVFSWPSSVANRCFFRNDVFTPTINGMRARPWCHIPTLGVGMCNWISGPSTDKVAFPFK